MTPDCDQLQDFLDDRLDLDGRTRFERHLLGCAACQADLDDALQLHALNAELSRDSDTWQPAVAARRGGRLAPARSRRRAWVMAGAALVAGSALVLLLVRPRAQLVPLEERIAWVLAPRRAIEDRLPFAAADRHREYDTVRDDSRPRESIPMSLIAELEAERDATGLAAVMVLRSDWNGVEAALAASPPGAAIDVERAVVHRRRGRAAEALALLDAVLARDPRQAQALWNRALVLRDLDLPLASARAFDAVAALGEPGWAGEATGRAAQLRSIEATRDDSWHEAHAACVFPAAKPPASAVIRRHPSLCRVALYEGIRLATTRAELEALLPVAQEIDRAMGDTASSAYVGRIAKRDLARRAQNVAAYRTLTATPRPPPAEIDRVVARLRAAQEDDLVRGALRQTGAFRDHRAEYLRLMQATGDPFLAEVAIEREAEADLADGQPLAAEMRLRRAVRDCELRDVEYRCGPLARALGSLYLKLHRPTEARATLLAALVRSKRLGLFGDERLLFNLLAEAARFAREYPLMRAYLEEATLRVRECRQLRYAQELLAIAEIGELRFADARRDIDRAPLCGDPPTLVRSVVLAELARIDGTADEAASLRDGMQQLRRQGKLSTGQLVHADSIEGRLLSVRDPAAARDLLHRTVEAADQLGPGDVSGTKARAYAYQTLLMLAAGDGDFAQALELLGAMTGAVAAPRCVVGVVTDNERALVVARDAAGELLHDLRQSATRPDLDIPSLIAPAITQALSACPRVDVLAAPPVHGNPGLLPPALAWSYRARTRALPPPATVPVILVISDAEAPAELGLARLTAAVGEPIPGTQVVHVRGAQATPSRVIAEMPRADVIEIHAHGYVDLGLSDASLIALSAEPGGQFALRARDVSAQRLVRGPLVLLAACHAAHTAPYLHESWSLPSSFLLAGARAVLAPSTPIPDQAAGEFFRAVEQRVLGGEDPAIVLRDERVRRLASDPRSWARDVLLFD